MGNSTYSSSVFTSTVGAKIAAGTTPFGHTSSVKSGAVAAAVHPSLDPAGKNKAGIIIRESRDSDAHPDSVGVVLIADQTGSMDIVPRTFVEKLGKLMSLIVSKGYLADPHILFGAIGDAYCHEVAPLQIGQFEAGNQMDSALTNILLENGGGGQMHESYELALWFLAEYASMDCFEKRGRKGYLFIFGDELPYDFVSKDQVERLTGVKLENDIPLDEILAKVQEKFELFWVMPGGTMYWGNPSVEKPQQKRFGERFIKLEKPEEMAELVAATIGSFEGYDVNTIVKDLVDAGLSKAGAQRATQALVPFTASGVLSKKAAVIEGELTLGGTDNVSRL